MVMNLKNIIKEVIDGLEWIKNVKPTLNDAFEKRTLKVGDVLTLSGELADCDAKTTKEVNDFKIKITKLRKKINNSHFIPLQKKYWKHLEYDGKGDTRFYTSDGKMKIEDHHNELMESNELDWIKDIVNIKLDKTENWMLVNDIDRESIAEGHEIQKYLFDLGYSWGTGDLKNSLKDFCVYTIYHFGNVKKGDQIYYGDGCRSAEVRVSNKDIKSGEYMVYYWSDLKPKTIKEENDFDWIEDVKPRLPLRVGTCLTFKHSKEEEEWVEDEYGNMVDHGKMNWHITSKFIDVYNDDKPTFSMVATDRMGEGRQIFMEVEKVKELYEEGVYEPCKKQPYLKRVMNEADGLDWIRNTTPNKWDYFEELIKDEPEINIEKNEDGEWVDFKDNKNRPYFGTDFYVDYELERDIKSNPLPDFLNAVSQHIEVTFQGYDYEEDEDYWDFLTLKEVLEKANEITQ